MPHSTSPAPDLMALARLNSLLKPCMAASIWKQALHYTGITVLKSQHPGITVWWVIIQRHAHFA